MNALKLLTVVLSLPICLCLSNSLNAAELLSASLSGNNLRSSLLPDISANGKWAAFSALGINSPNGSSIGYDIYVRNLENGDVERLDIAGDGNVPNHTSEYPVLNADGRFVAFYSWASNLVLGDNNNSPDVFIHDRVSGTTEIVNVATDGSLGEYPSGGAAISADGRYVAFHTVSTLAPEDNSGSIGVYLRDLKSKTTRFIDHGVWPSISSDGSVLAYRSGGSVMLADLISNTYEEVARINSDALQNNHNAYLPSISGDGRYVTFEGGTSANLPLSTDVFVYDREEKKATKITNRYDGSALTTASGPYNMALRPKMSSDGRYVVYLSTAADLVKGFDGKQLYRYDMLNNITERFEIDDLWSIFAFHYFEVSGDGSKVVFHDLIASQAPETKFSGVGVFLANCPVPDSDPGQSEGPEGVTLIATPNVLWPPNSNLVNIDIAVNAPSADRIEIEIVDEYGIYDQIIFGSKATVPLEAWRKGNDKDGRTYKVNATAVSATGERSAVNTTVIVPHDKR